MEERGDNLIYKVVVNHEEQHPIWPVKRENPLDWKDLGKSVSRRNAWPMSKKSGPACDR
jgi:MbtH protein